MFQIRCRSTYYRLGLALKSVFSLRAAFAPILFTPQRNTSDLSLFSLHMPSTMWLYPLYPKFLVPTPTYKYYKLLMVDIAFPISCPPSLSMQLKSKLRVSILREVIFLTKRLMGLTALSLRWLKYTSSLKILSWLKFLSPLAMYKVPFSSILLLLTNSYTDLSLSGLSLDVKVVKFWKASGPSLLAVKSIDSSCISSLKGCMNRSFTPLSPIFSSISPNLRDFRSKLDISLPRSSPMAQPVATELRLRCRCRTDWALMCLKRWESCDRVSLQLSRLMYRISTEMVWLKKLLMIKSGSWQQAKDKVKLLISLFSRTFLNLGMWTCSS